MSMSVLSIGTRPWSRCTCPQQPKVTLLRHGLALRGEPTSPRIEFLAVTRQPSTVSRLRLPSPQQRNSPSNGSLDAETDRNLRRFRRSSTLATEMNANPALHIFGGGDGDGDGDGGTEGCNGNAQVGPGARDTQVQLVISLLLGVSAFLAFCVGSSPLFFFADAQSSTTTRLSARDGSPSTPPASDTSTRPSVCLLSPTPSSDGCPPSTRLPSNRSSSRPVSTHSFSWPSSRWP